MRGLLWLAGMLAAGCAASGADAGKKAQEYVREGLRQESEGHRPQAIEAYSAALQLSPGDVVALEHRARLFLENGESQKALIDCNRVLQIKPDSSEALKLRGD